MNALTKNLENQRKKAYQNFLKAKKEYELIDKIYKKHIKKIKKYEGST